MKRLFAALLAFALLLAGCGKEEDAAPEMTAVLPAEHGMSVSAPEEEFIEIKDRLFIAQTNDIYLNPDDYFDKTIKYEGLFKIADWGEADLHFFVLRYGPGCCGYDGQAGFEIYWEGDIPKEDDWVEVVGRVEYYDYNGWDYLRFNVSSLKILDERGAEYVTT